jgi:hypothetical protein
MHPGMAGGGVGVGPMPRRGAGGARGRLWRGAMPPGIAGGSKNGAAQQLHNSVSN